MIAEPSILSGRLGRIEFAMAAAAFFFCKIVLLYVDSTGTIPVRLTRYIDLALLITLILIPAALRFHDFNRSAKWPVLIIVLGCVATIVTTVLVLSAAQSSKEPVEITFDSLSVAARAFLLLPFWVVMAIGLFVPGTVGANRFGEPAKSILGGWKRSD